MKPADPPPAKSPSLTDFFVRYDLAAMVEEARADYLGAASGGPRHLGQEDIAARFRKVTPPPKAADEPS